MGWLGSWSLGRDHQPVGLAWRLDPTPSCRLTVCTQGSAHVASFFLLLCIRVYVPTVCGCLWVVDAWGSLSPGWCNVEYTRSVTVLLQGKMGGKDLLNHQPNDVAHFLLFFPLEDGSTNSAPIRCCYYFAVVYMWLSFTLPADHLEYKLFNMNAWREVWVLVLWGCYTKNTL